MRFKDFKIIKESPEPDIIRALRDFLPIAVNELKLKRLPKIKFLSKLDNDEQPTFGSFMHDGANSMIALNIMNRHPVDVLRTLAHELVHYKQFVHKQLGQNSGDTGSSSENEAHVVAGIIMRHFDKKYPEYLSSNNISDDSTTEFNEAKVTPSTKDKKLAKSLEDYANKHIPHSEPGFGDFMYHAELIRKGHKDVHKQDLNTVQKKYRDVMNDMITKHLNEAIAPHGSPENEFKMMQAGNKPAALVDPTYFKKLYKKTADANRWPYFQISIPGHKYGNVVVGLPGQEKRIHRIAELVSDMNVNFMGQGIKPGKEYHMELGKLLGYADSDIQEFLKKMNLDEEYRDADYARGNEKMPKAKPGRTKHPLHGKLVGE